MAMTEIYLSLGSNLGDREGNLEQAVEMLSDALGVQPEAVSSVIETEPWGFESENKFLNQCVLYSVSQIPQSVRALQRRPAGGYTGGGSCEGASLRGQEDRALDGA